MTSPRIPLRTTSSHAAGALALAALAACGPRAAPSAPAAPAAPRDRIAIVVSERGPAGAHLVSLDERGDRQEELVAAPTERVRDSHPAISPDGRWLVFASTRGARDGTRLWIAPLGPEATPVPLTAGAPHVIDTHPVWVPAGDAIVFASTRDGGDYDLYRLAIDAAGHASGAPVALTSGPGHEVTPTIAADGTIVYAAVTPGAHGEVESHLERRAPDGTLTQLTNGPADASPALSPDGRTLVFSRPVRRGDTADAELWTMPAAGGPARVLVSVPLTDESGPVWSPDGRYLLATSILRGAAGDAVFSAIIVLDLREAPVRARMLEDHAGAVARFTPAVTTAALDDAALASNPAYLPELARIVQRTLDTQRAATPTPTPTP